MTICVIICVCVCVCAQVVSKVDFLLQSQDLNQDGLLAPSELLSPPLPHSQVQTNYSGLHVNGDEQSAMV